MQLVCGIDVRQLPTSPGAKHVYAMNWPALSAGEDDAVILEIDDEVTVDVLGPVSVDDLVTTSLGRVRYDYRLRLLTVRGLKNE